MTRHRRPCARPEALRVNGLDEPVAVRRHPAARRMTLRVSRTSRSVTVTVPPGCDLADAGSFLSTNLAWVQQRLVNVPKVVPLHDGAIVPLRGVPHVVRVTPPDRSQSIVRVATAACGCPALVVACAPAGAGRRLKTWLMREAARDLERSVAHHARSLGLAPLGIAVRDQKSRWGSCSTTGLLSFSWRLVLAPPFILDYVAAHEVAHLAEMNHGPRFWALVRKTMPRTDEARRWLRVSGMDLHRYAPTR